MKKLKKLIIVLVMVICYVKINDTLAYFDEPKIDVTHIDEDLFNNMIYTSSESNDYHNLYWIIDYETFASKNTWRCQYLDANTYTLTYFSQSGTFNLNNITWQYLDTEEKYLIINLFESSSGIWYEGFLCVGDGVSPDCYNKNGLVAHQEFQVGGASNLTIQSIYNTLSTMNATMNATITSNISDAYNDGFDNGKINIIDRISSIVNANIDYQINLNTYVGARVYDYYDKTLYCWDNYYNIYRPFDDFDGTGELTNFVNAIKALWNAKYALSLSQTTYLDGLNAGKSIGFSEGNYLGIIEGFKMGVRHIFNNGFKNIPSQYGDINILQETESKPYQNGQKDGLIIQETDIDAYNRGLRDGTRNAMINSLDKWLVPAVFIVIVAGGIVSIIAIKKRGEM